MTYTWFDMDAATILLAGDNLGLRNLLFRGGKHCPLDWTPPEDWTESPRDFQNVIIQLQEWLQGRRFEFDVEIAPEGTAFQQTVWAELQSIPYGETATYGDLAERIGNPPASRAVGAANGKNPISIIIPCHRVIGSSGQLVGYGGGLNVKQWLLLHEQQYAARKLSCGCC